MHSYENKIGLVAKCAKIESDSETAFKTWLNDRGFTFKRKATKVEDMKQHIDCFVEIAGKTLSVDLKGLKKHTSQGLFAVELQNVQGLRGWLFGKADLIAFQCEDSFIVVERNSLFKTLRDILSLVVMTKNGFHLSLKGARSNSVPCALPNWYCREDRPKEKVVFVTKDILTNLSLYSNIPTS
jgi:hypothetical protein